MKLRSVLGKTALSRFPGIISIFNLLKGKSKCRYKEYFKVKTSTQVFSPCGKTAIIAQCTKKSSVMDMDIYEVFDENDFIKCSNIPKNPAHHTSGNYIEGFLAPFSIQPRYFVNKQSCEKGFKIKITYEQYCKESLENPVTDGA